MSKFTFTKRNIAQPSFDESLEEFTSELDDFELTESMHACIDEADDIALLLIANGVDSAELAAFAKVSAILAKGSYNKDVSLVVQRKWTKTMDESVQLNIPKEHFQQAYDTRTTIHKSVINALSALLHLGKTPQMYVSTLRFQEDRYEIPEKFVESFAAYDQVTSSDAQTSQEFLVKSVKSGVESYKSVGGITSLVDVPLDGNKVVPTILKVANAYQKDKSPLISKISDPFHFVCNKIDAPKRQSLEHMAMRRVLPFCPKTVFYSVDDKMSLLDLENHQLTALPKDYAPYLKFKTLGNIGDVLTNVAVYEKLGVDFSIPDGLLQIPLDERKYSDSILGFFDVVGQCVQVMETPGYFDAPENFKFGRFDAERFVPARFGRSAGVDDLEKYRHDFQLISLGTLAGARKKNGHIFNAFRFYLIDIASHMCLAVPVGYIAEFASFSIIEKNKAEASTYSSLFVTTNNVEQYISACSEVNSLTFPLLWRFYRDLSLRADIPGIINTVFEAIKDSVNGISFSRIVNMFGDQFDTPYSFLVGSEKIDDRRVVNFCNEAKLDLITDFSPRTSAKKVTGPSFEVIQKRKVAFTFSKSSVQEDSPPGPEAREEDVPPEPGLQDSGSTENPSHPVTEEERQLYLDSTGV